VVKSIGPEGRIQAGTKENGAESITDGTMRSFGGSILRRGSGSNTFDIVASSFEEFDHFRALAKFASHVKTYIFIGSVFAKAMSSKPTVEEV
jgi:hypothetical protein